MQQYVTQYYYTIYCIPCCSRVIIRYVNEDYNVSVNIIWVVQQILVLFVWRNITVMSFITSVVTVFVTFCSISGFHHHWKSRKCYISNTGGTRSLCVTARRVGVCGLSCHLPCSPTRRWTFNNSFQQGLWAQTRLCFKCYARSPESYAHPLDWRVKMRLKANEGCDELYVCV